MNIRLTIAACCTAVGLAGCTNLPDAQDYSTSLGASQQQMREDPEWSAGRVWVRPGPALSSQYDKKLILEKVEYIQGDRPDDLKLSSDPALRERALAYVNEALRREFSQAGYRLLDTPAPRAMRVRAAITGTFRNDRDPRAMEYIPIGFLIGQGVKAAGFRHQSVRLLVEATVRDAGSNELLIASVGTVTGANLPADHEPTVDDMRSAVDEWARRVREQFERIRQEGLPEDAA